MADLFPWLAPALWLGALVLRIHPRTRDWAPRGIAGRRARKRTRDRLAGPPSPPPVAVLLPADVLGEEPPALRTVVAEVSR